MRPTYSKHEITTFRKTIHVDYTENRLDSLNKQTQKSYPAHQFDMMSDGIALSRLARLELHRL